MSVRSIPSFLRSARPLRLLLPGLLLLATACTLIPPRTTDTAGQGTRPPLTATFLGNTTILIDDGTDQILIDGFLTRPGLIPVAAGRIRTHPPTVDAALHRAGANRIRALFVAHSHYDHAMDASYVIHRTKRTQKTGAILHGSASTLNIGRGGDLAESDMALFQPYLPIKIGRHFTVTVIPSEHTPAIPGINDDLGHTIDKPLRQPASKNAYAEGGSHDFLIRHGTRTILVKPSANYKPGALDHIRADVLFLGVTGLGTKTSAYRQDFYDNTVRKVHATRVIPIHWDNFFCPLGERLKILLPLDQRGLHDLQQRLTADGRTYQLLQGYQTITIE